MYLIIYFIEGKRERGKEIRDKLLQVMDSLVVVSYEAPNVGFGF